MSVILQRIIIIAIIIFIAGLISGIGIGILICEKIDKRKD